jgi:hypothetical protein
MTSFPSRLLKGGIVLLDATRNQQSNQEQQDDENLKTETEEKVSPKSVCGPDITNALIQVIQDVKSLYASLNEKNKSDVCTDLVVIPAAFDAWDIKELHDDTKWLLDDYGFAPGLPGCSTPPCKDSVQVNNRCHYIHAVNYVIFGVMMNLCGYPEKLMKPMIFPYKTLIGSKVTTNAIQWAEAGFKGWPVGGASPELHLDLLHCKPCKVRYTGKFTFDWSPITLPKKRLEPVVPGLKETA